MGTNYEMKWLTVSEYLASEDRGKRGLPTSSRHIFQNIKNTSSQAMLLLNEVDRREEAHLRQKVLSLVLREILFLFFFLGESGNYKRGR